MATRLIFRLQRCESSVLLLVIPVCGPIFRGYHMAVSLSARACICKLRVYISPIVDFSTGDIEMNLRDMWAFRLIRSAHKQRDWFCRCRLLVMYYKPIKTIMRSLLLQTRCRLGVSILRHAGNVDCLTRARRLTTDIIGAYRLWNGVKHMYLGLQGWEIHCVQKKTPTRIFFHISISDV